MKTHKIEISEEQRNFIVKALSAYIEDLPENDSVSAQIYDHVVEETTSLHDMFADEKALDNSIKENLINDFCYRSLNH